MRDCKCLGNDLRAQVVTALKGRNKYREHTGELVMPRLELNLFQICFAEIKRLLSQAGRRLAVQDYIPFETVYFLHSPFS